MNIERIKIIKENDDTWKHQCDLCDEELYPMFSWSCWHDDDQHWTTVCVLCITELNKTIPDGMRIDLFLTKSMKKHMNKEQ